MFEKATKEKAKLRVAIDGPAKSGKTYTALVLAETVTKTFGGRIALIDTERGSASKFADIFDFDVAELPDFHPDQFMKAIKTAAGDKAYSVLIIDSLSHEWIGDHGVLQLVQTAQKQTKNQFAAWEGPSSLHSRLVDTMLQSDIHLIATMRSKMAYAQITDDKGRTKIEKVGLKPVQREGVEYEFDVLITMDNEHTATVSGSRCPDMDNRRQNRPEGDFFEPLLNWISTGAEPKPKAKPKPSPVTSEKKTEPQPKDKAAMWADFLKEKDITKEEALKLLGADSVNEWVRQDKSRRLEDAIEEIKKVLAFLNEYDITLTKAEKILGSDLKEWRQSNSTRAIQDAIDEIVAVGGLTKPAQ